MDKSADTPFAAIGETVTYTIVVSHTPGSTAPAFDVVIDDPLAPGVMRLVSGTVITSEGIVLIGNGSGDGSIRIVVPELLLGQTVTITYSVEIIGVPTPAGAAINTAVVSGSSAPDEVPAEFVRNVSASDDAEVSISSGGFFPAGAALDRSLLADYELQTFRPLIFSPIYAGTGNPGSALQITAADASGAPLSYATTIVDAGGNWIVQFPVSFWQSSPVGNVADRLSDTMLFNDRDYGIGAALPQASAGQIYAGQLQPTSSRRALLRSDAIRHGARDRAAAPYVRWRVLHPHAVLCGTAIRRTDRLQSAACPTSGTDLRASSPQSFKAGVRCRER